MSLFSKLGRLLGNSNDTSQNISADERTDDFEVAYDNKNVLFEDETRTVVIYFMWPAHKEVGNHPPREHWISHGRLIEVSHDRIIISAMTKVPKYRKRHDQFKDWYASGAWRTGSKQFKAEDVRGWRLISENRFHTLEGTPVPPFHIIVLDYGTRATEVNYEEMSGFSGNQIGHFSSSSEYALELHSTLNTATQKHFQSRTHSSSTQNLPPSPSENEILDTRPMENRHSSRTHDDPF